MARIASFFGDKGNVEKMTLFYKFSAVISDHGHRGAMIDTDGQGQVKAGAELGALDRKCPIQ